MGLDPVDRPVAAGPFNRLQQGLGLRLQSAQRGARGSRLALGGIALGRRLLPGRFGGPDRLTGFLELGLGLLTPHSRCLKGLDQRIVAAEPAQLFLDPRRFGFGPDEFLACRFQGRQSDPGFSLLRRLDGTDLAQFGFGGPRLVLVLDGADLDRSATAFRFLEAGRDRRKLLVEPLDRIFGVLAKPVFARLVRGEGPLAFTQFVDPAPDRVAFGAQSGQLVAEL